MCYLVKGCGLNWIISRFHHHLTAYLNVKYEASFFYSEMPSAERFHSGNWETISNSMTPFAFDLSRSSVKGVISLSLSLLLNQSPFLFIYLFSVSLLSGNTH